MKKLKIFSVLSVCLMLTLMTLGFVLMACATTGSGEPVPPPVLTSFITVTQNNGITQQWVPETSFPETEGINVGIRGDNPGKTNIRQFVFTIKSDGVEVNKFTTNVSISNLQFTQYIGSFRFSPGDYVVEVYAVDRRGNQSNTLSTAFSVR